LRDRGREGGREGGRERERGRVVVVVIGVSENDKSDLVQAKRDLVQGETE
jgi:hypothetical protein